MSGISGVKYWNSR